ncbi:MAG: metallophosphoesterase [Ignavibacteriae bacterium]|nr:metallophosphoesterase [Ignavibacteriota bacterium]
MRAAWAMRVVYVMVVGVVVCVCAPSCVAQTGVVEGAPAQLPAFETRDRLPAPALAFVVIGDWGGAAKELRALAAGLARKHEDDPVAAVLAAGGNFLDGGVAGIDDPQWESKFESVFGPAELKTPLWAVPGMADAKGDVDAQTRYRSRNATISWNMPARNWTTVFSSADGSLHVRITGIDTPGLLAAAETERSRQVAWLDSVCASSKEERHIVLGHHPVYSNGRNGNTLGMIRHVKPILEKHRVDAYLAGRDNDLQVLSRVNSVGYLVSGAAVRARDTRWAANTLFAAAVRGFLWLQVNKDALLVQCVDTDGQVLFSTRL